MVLAAWTLAKVMSVAAEEDLTVLPAGPDAAAPAVTPASQRRAFWHSMHGQQEISLTEFQRRVPAAIKTPQPVLPGCETILTELMNDE